jgi:hypothetical protein
VEAVVGGDDGVVAGLLRKDKSSFKEIKSSCYIPNLLFPFFWENFVLFYF